MKTKTAQFNRSRKGFSPVFVIIAILLIFAFGGGAYFAVSRGLLPFSFLRRIVSGVDKSDPEWKKKYCTKEIAKVPGAPFTYKEKSEVVMTGPSLYIRSKHPQSAKISDIRVCSYSYSFDPKVAYPSIGIEYDFDIKNLNAFDDATAEAYAAAVDSSWKRLPKIPREDSGTPWYVTDSLPVVFTRQNKALGTTEYLDVFNAVDFT